MKAIDYYLFIDESGDHGLSNIDNNFPIFVLCGILIKVSEYNNICAKMDALKVKYFGTKDIILHNNEIRRYEGVFSILFNPEIKIQFYNDLNSLLTNGDYVIISSAILKEKHIQKYGKLADDPYEISLTFVLERCLFQTDSDTEDNLIQVMIESRGSKEDQQISKRYNELLYRGSQVASSRFLQRFTTELVVKKKYDNDCGLQLSDLCTYPIARHILYPNIPYVSYDVIEKKIRRSKSKGVNGYGLKVFP